MEGKRERKAVEERQEKEWKRGKEEETWGDLKENVWHDATEVVSCTGAPYERVTRYRAIFRPRVRIRHYDPEGRS